MISLGEIDAELLQDCSASASSTPNRQLIATTPPEAPIRDDLG